MRYQLLGQRTGLRVSQLSLGAGLFGTGWGYGADPTEARRMFDRFLERTADRELMPMAEALGLGVALWSPLAGGLLTGKYRAGEQGRLQAMGRIVHTEKTARGTAIVDGVLEVAKDIGKTPTEVALAWVLEKSRRSSTSLVPIIGPRTLQQLETNLTATEITLPDDQFANLEQVSQVTLGVPHEVNQATRPQMAGGRAALIDFPTVVVI
jgi:aryl-alcohol dehydrogenase-like predicted oxidoreductase